MASRNRFTEFPLDLVLTAPAVPIASLPASPNSSSDTENWGTKRTAQYLGMSIRTLYRRVDGRKITCRKEDGALKFRKSDLDRYRIKRTLRGE
jgi:hypothetical protein